MTASFGASRAARTTSLRRAQRSPAHLPGVMARRKSCTGGVLTSWPSRGSCSSVSYKVNSEQTTRQTKITPVKGLFEGAFGIRGGVL